MIHGPVGKHEGQGGRNRDDLTGEKEKEREYERMREVLLERRIICGD
jgi:hypothetical protein